VPGPPSTASGVAACGSWPPGSKSLSYGWAGAIEPPAPCFPCLAEATRSPWSLVPAVWLGALAGIVISIILGVVFVVVFYVANNKIFSGNGELIFKGVRERGTNAVVHCESVLPCGGGSGSSCVVRVG
jgi:hypothetical protein